MASASRPNRKSARISSPTRRDTNGVPAPAPVPVQEKVQTTLGKWVEPPLRPPVPSFMDHKGLERVGVLENMMPLGTFPTVKQKAKAKAEPLLRSVQKKRLDNGRPRSARQTPERASSADTSRAQSDPVEGASLPLSSHEVPSGSLNNASSISGNASSEAIRPGTLLSGQPVTQEELDRHPGLAKGELEIRILTDRAVSKGKGDDTHDNTRSRRSRSRLATPETRDPEAKRKPREDGPRPFLDLLGELIGDTKSGDQPGKEVFEETEQHSDYLTAPQSTEWTTADGTPSASAVHLSPAIKKAFEMALEQAEVEDEEDEDGDANVRPRILQMLIEEAREHPDFQKALEAVARSKTLATDHSSKFYRKVGELKRKFRAELSLSPQKQGAESSRSAKRLKISPPVRPSSSKSPTAAVGLRISQPISHRRNQSPSPLPDSSSKASLANGILSGEAAESNTVESSLQANTAAAGTLSRRSSSSSLSSVDEALVKRPPLSLNMSASEVLEAQDDEFLGVSGDSRPNHKRSYAEFIEDEEFEAKRRSLRQTFDDLEVKESSIRPQPRLRVSRAVNNSNPSFQPDQARSLSYYNHDANGNILSPDSGSSDLSERATPELSPSRAPTKAKNAARIKLSPLKKKSAVVAGLARPETRRGGSVGDDDKSDSDNDDYCSACQGSGYLLCCDGCDRSFHFTCLDPPLDQDAGLDEPWYCYICQAIQAPPSAGPRGLFAEMLQRIAKKNPTAFELPNEIRGYFEGVKTGADGEYEELSQQRSSTRGRMGYDEQPDFRKTRDAKGNTIMCFRCGKSSLDGRDIIPCDYCSLHWHLDCLDPPLANPPNRSGADVKTRNAWMCPNHVDHDLRRLDPVDPAGVNYDGVARTHRVRRPKNAKVLDTALRRGFRNNGLIEVDDASSEDDEGYDSEFDGEGIVRRLPRTGIKLDFIEQVKNSRAARIQQETERVLAAEATRAELRLMNEQAIAENQARLTADLRRRSFMDQKTALNLAQFATNNSDLNLGQGDVEMLINALTAEAPADVVSRMTESEIAASATRKATETSIPPSPPPSDQPDSSAISEAQKNQLLKLQELIRRKLESPFASSS